MPTYLGVDVITMPSSPSSPSSIEFSVVDIIAMNVSPFTGQQQVQDWQATFMEGSLQLPPLTDAQAPDWLTFLRDLKGMKNVFQFQTAFSAAYSSSIGSRYWRLKSNERKWSIGEARVYGISFEFREAI